MHSNTFKFKGGQSIGSNPFLSELMRSFELEKPIFRSLTPKWVLSCVLWSLTLCSLKYKASFMPFLKRKVFSDFSDGSVNLLC